MTQEPDNWHVICERLAKKFYREKNDYMLLTVTLLREAIILDRMQDVLKLIQIIEDYHGLDNECSTAHATNIDSILDADLLLNEE